MILKDNLLTFLKSSVVEVELARQELATILETTHTEEAPESEKIKIEEFISKLFD